MYTGFRGMSKRLTNLQKRRNLILKNMGNYSINVKDPAKDVLIWGGTFEDDKKEFQRLFDEKD